MNRHVLLAFADEMAKLASTSGKTYTKVPTHDTPSMKGANTTTVLSPGGKRVAGLPKVQSQSRGKPQHINASATALQKAFEKR